MAKRSKKSDASADGAVATLEAPPAPAAATLPPAPGTAKPTPLVIACRFKSANFPDAEKVTIGISISREHISVEQADELLCGAQLRVVLRLGHPNQLKLPGTEDIDTLEVVADVKSFGATPKKISATLHMHRDGIDTIELARYAAQDGSIEAIRTGAAVGKSKKGPAAAAEAEAEAEAAEAEAEAADDADDDVRPPVLQEKERERRKA